MIVDFHTHIFPGKIAYAAVSKLAATIKIQPYTNGCEEGLLASMEEAEVDCSVVLPVVTDKKQFDSILKFAVYLNEKYDGKQTGKLLSFAGIHPDSDELVSQLALIAREGFKGIKVHPNYQGVYFNDARYKNLLYRASEVGLTVLTHAGYDPYTPKEEFCTPDMILDVIRDVAPQNLVVAHLGSNMHYEEAYEKLAGQDIYMDTAHYVEKISEEQFADFVRRHGADKILFASDSPWSDQKKCVAIVKNSSLKEEEKSRILSENAMKLLF